MTHDENHNPVTKNCRTHAQVTKSNLERKEEINSPQQHHGINSLNGEMLDCDTNEAQMLVDVMCDTNQTFRTKENLVDPWKKSWMDNEK